MVLFHLIDNFKRGGAETLLYHVVKNLEEHRHYIITLTGEIDFLEEELKGMTIIPLGFSSFVSLPGVVFRLKKLIKSHQPDIIHAHLPLSSLVARLATPRRIKLFISVHNTYSESLQKVSPRLFWLEKKLHSRRDNLVFVSGAIKKDYQYIVGIKGRSFILYNFIADKFFASASKINVINNQPAKLRLVAIGSLKHQKNFDTLIKAFGFLDKARFSLDIYGEGPERGVLESLVLQHDVPNVQLKGPIPDVENQLKNYDAFILPSRYEGFGLAPLEAAAVGLPLLLSDIEVFQEVTKGYARFFSAGDEKNIAAALQLFYDNYQAAFEKAAAFRPLVQQSYSRDSYIRQLLNIYTS